MKFANPLFLIALSAVLIPIIIHLFNFRKYKTVYFSNVKMLEDVLLKTKKESRLQQYIVLALRVLAIAALAIAFAQPFIPKNNLSSHKGNVVTIFVDNSFSMDANSKDGTLLYDAVEAAKNVVNAFSYADDFVLTTQDFSSKESHILNKDEILSMLDDIQPSAQSHTMAEIVAFAQNTASYSHKSNHINYFISDFQKNTFDAAALKRDSLNRNFLIPIEVRHTDNVSIDSCWFLTPVFNVGQSVTLTVRIHNYGTTDVNKLPLKLYVNDEQKALAAVDVKAESYADYQMNYTITGDGVQCGVVRIEDSPIIFDDELFFVYTVASANNIIVVNAKENRYLKAMYGMDSLFVYQEMNEKQVNYSQFKTCNLLVLDQLQRISSGMASEVEKYVNAGGTLLFFPAEEMDESVNGFLAQLGVGQYGKLAQTKMKVGKVNLESVYFSGAIQSSSERMTMPTLTQYFPIASTAGTTAMEEVMSLENGSPFLTSYPCGQGRVLLCAVPLNDAFGDAQRNAIVFVPLHNAAIMNVKQGRLYNVMGRDEQASVPNQSTSGEKVFSLKSQDKSMDFIPEQRPLGNEIMLYFHSQITKSGIYDVFLDDVKITSLAFNFNRNESDLDYYDSGDLKDLAGDEVQVLDAQTKDLSKNIADSFNGIPLWRYFVLFALLCIIAEICVLRFWKVSAKIEAR
ncbi:MAG: BatA domain-containing protein [Bacteroidales bacterium]|nr:BatA domain-containing protein [Bacteroidales bacterium]